MTMMFIVMGVTSLVALGLRALRHHPIRHNVR